MNNRKKVSFLSKLIIFGILAFYYIPMLWVVIYSFNESRMVTVWQGFSTKWYGELLNDRAMMHAGSISLQLAVFSSTVAIVLGAMAGLVLARFGKFRGQTVFNSMITAPLVMPEVITALALMLFFISFQGVVREIENVTGLIAPDWLRKRGMLQMVIAHATFAASYVAVIISSRMREFDASIEEAAHDLGATPFHVYRTIILPLILPAIVSGWVMAFSMSLDNVVISAFIAGPGTTPLPVLVYSQMKMGVSPKINALAALIIFLVAFASILYGYYQYRLDKKRSEEMKMASSDDTPA